MVNGWSKQFLDICHTLGCVQPRLVSMKPKLRSYVMFKNIFKRESYVKMTHSKMSRSIFAQLRLGILPLDIETGRFRHIPSESRMCHFCKNEIEDELHFVYVCPVYSNHRKILLNEIIINFSNLV